MADAADRADAARQARQPASRDRGHASRKRVASEILITRWAFDRFIFFS